MLPRINDLGGVTIDGILFGRERGQVGEKLMYTNAGWICGFKSFSIWGK